MCCETSDNQIDFARLYYFPESDTYKIEQISEVVNRNRPGNDPIKKFLIIYDNSPGQDNSTG